MTSTSSAIIPGRISFAFMSTLAPLRPWWYLQETIEMQMGYFFLTPATISKIPPPMAKTPMIGGSGMVFFFSL